jgi:hypothetical protein
MTYNDFENRSVTDWTLNVMRFSAIQLALVIFAVSFNIRDSIFNSSKNNKIGLGVASGRQKD